MIFALVSENAITMNQVISLQDAVFVDNVIQFSVKQREKELHRFISAVFWIGISKGDRNVKQLY